MPLNSIRKQRKIVGLNIRELAARINISPSYLSRIERGEISPSEGIRKRLKTILGQPIDQKEQKLLWVKEKAHRKETRLSDCQRYIAQYLIERFREDILKGKNQDQAGWVIKEELAEKIKLLPEHDYDSLIEQGLLEMQGDSIRVRIRNKNISKLFSKDAHEILQLVDYQLCVKRDKNIMGKLSFDSLEMLLRNLLSENPVCIFLPAFSRILHRYTSHLPHFLGEELEDINLLKKWQNIPELFPWVSAFLCIDILEVQRDVKDILTESYSTFKISNELSRDTSNYILRFLETKDEFRDLAYKVFKVLFPINEIKSSNVFQGNFYHDFLQSFKIVGLSWLCWLYIEGYGISFSTAEIKNKASRRIAGLISSLLREDSIEKVKKVHLIAYEKMEYIKEKAFPERIDFLIDFLQFPWDCHE